MQLFLMRHGEAGFQAQSDRDRTLNDMGRYHTRLMSDFLSRFVSEFDLVLVSPYVRAQQTWLEVASHFPSPRKCLTLNDLTPSSDPTSAATLVTAYAEQYKADKVLVIAHMPLLGYLVSEMVRGVEPPLFATSAICLLDRHGEQCHQVWMQNPHTVS